MAARSNVEVIKGYLHGDDWKYRELDSNVLELRVRGENAGHLLGIQADSANGFVRVFINHFAQIPIESRAAAAVELLRINEESLLARLSMVDGVVNIDCVYPTCGTMIKAKQFFALLHGVLHVADASFPRVISLVGPRPGRRFSWREPRLWRSILTAASSCSTPGSTCKG
jgi:hypothetical protein